MSFLTASSSYESVDRRKGQDYSAVFAQSIASGEACRPMMSHYADMIPAEFHDFLVASTQASAALIGLLFVSVSIAPERVFGSKAEALRQARALSAFTSLANVFFISFVSLIPGINVGVAVTVIALIGVLQTLGLLALVPQWRSEGVIIRSLILFAGTIAVYGGELWLGILLWRVPAATGALSGIAQLLLAAYAIGLVRAWELLGAPRIAPFQRMLGRLVNALDRMMSPKHQKM